MILKFKQNSNVNNDLNVWLGQLFGQCSSEISILTGHTECFLILDDIGSGRGCNEISFWSNADLIGWTDPDEDMCYFEVVSADLNRKIIIDRIEKHCNENPAFSDDVFDSMRDRILDCVWADLDEDAVSELSSKDVVKGIEKH